MSSLAFPNFIPNFNSPENPNETKFDGLIGYYCLLHAYRYWLDTLNSYPIVLLPTFVPLLVLNCSDGTQIKGGKIPKKKIKYQ